jgi:tellurite resistance protein
MSQQSLRFLPVSLFGASMGLLGTGLACRVARDLIGWPAWLAEIWIGLGLVAITSLFVAYALKIARHRDAVRAEFAATGQAMFAGAAPIGLTLAAAGLAPYLPAVGRVLWWTGASVLLAWQVVALARVLRGGVAITDIHPGWFLTFIGGIVVPLGAVALEMGPAADVSFAVSVAATPMVMGIVLWRLIVGPPLPDGMKPIGFILVVPPAVIFLNYGSMAAAPAGYGVDMLYYAAWLIALALAWNARGAFRWPFTPAWWAFTFPLAGLAGASLRHLEGYPGPHNVAIAHIALAVANVVVATVLVRTLRALAAGRYLVPPPAPPAKPAAAGTLDAAGTVQAGAR